MINPETLATLRQQSGLSQRKLAKLIGLNYQVIRRIEAGGDCGNLTLRDLARLAGCLDCAPTDLLNVNVPASRPAEPLGGKEMDVAQARLLRRLQRGADVRTTLSGIQRETILPALMRRQLIAASSTSPLALSPTASNDLAAPW